MPAGAIFGLPVGLSFFAGAWSEGTLIRLACAFEQATQARRAPHVAAPARQDPVQPQQEAALVAHDQGLVAAGVEQHALHGGGQLGRLRP